MHAVVVQAQTSPDAYSEAARALGTAASPVETERAVAMLLSAVNAQPDDRRAPVALLNVGAVLERLGRTGTALRLYQRIVDETVPRLASASDEDREAFESAVAGAYFRTGRIADANYELDAAFDAYRSLADSTPMNRSNDPTVQAQIVESLFGAARVSRSLQRYGDAAVYYRRTAEHSRDANLQRHAFWRAALSLVEAGDRDRAFRELSAFANRYASDRAAGVLVVEAYWQAAQLRPSPAALQHVITAFSRIGGVPGSRAAQRAAEARIQIERELVGSSTPALRPVRRRTSDRAVVVLEARYTEAAAAARIQVERWQTVFAYRVPGATLTALVEQGSVYSSLAAAVRAVALRGAPESERVAFSEALENRAQPLECLAIVRFVLAARMARTAYLPEYREVATRLNAFGDPRIAECIEGARQEDASLGAVRSGEFAVARAGLSAPLLSPGPPRLAGAATRGSR